MSDAYHITAADLAAEAAEAAYYEKLVKETEAAAAAWRATWPNACARCHGHGGTYDPGNYWNPPEFDPCGALADTACHRCGAAGLTEDGEGPCSACGWNYDDGEPTL